MQHRSPIFQLERKPEHARPRSLTGYTLIEMLVVISITVLMSGVLLAYNRESEKQLVLGVEQARIVGFLSRAKSFALGKYTGIITTGDYKGKTASPLACAFGVSFDPASGKMTLFQDLPYPEERCSKEGGESNFDKRFAGIHTTEEVDFLQLDRRLKFKAGSAQDIVFEAPYLRTYENGQELDASNNTAVVTVEIVDDTSRSVTIEVGLGGQIVSH